MSSFPLSALSLPLPLLFTFFLLSLLLSPSFLSFSLSSSPSDLGSSSEYEFILDDYREEYEISMGRRPRPSAPIAIDPSQDVDYSEIDLKTPSYDPTALSSLERIERNTNRTDRSPPFIPYHYSDPHWALLLVGPKCQFKNTPNAREFIRKWGPWYYPQLEVNYLGGTGRIQMYKTRQGRFDSIIESEFWGADELLELLLDPTIMESLEQPVSTIGLEGLTEQDMEVMLDLYGIRKGFPRREAPPLQ